MFGISDATPVALHNVTFSQEKRKLVCLEDDEKGVAGQERAAGKVREEEGATVHSSISAWTFSAAQDHQSFRIHQASEEQHQPERLSF